MNLEHSGYSLAMAAAIWTASYLLYRQILKFKLNTSLFSSIIIATLPLGIIGARLVYVAQNWSIFGQDPAMIWQITSGGLSIHGGLLGGLIGLLIVCRRYRLSLLTLTDLLALPLLVGQIIGRMGNYFNQELFGYPTELAWAISIDPQHRPAGYEQFSRFHPVFAYEMIFHGLGLAALLWLRRRRRGDEFALGSGQVTAIYLVTSGLARYLTEIWRISDRVVGPLSAAQLVSLAMIVTGLFLAIRVKYRPEV